MTRALVSARRSSALAAVVLTACIAAVHWPPADADFNLDDHGFVADNASIRSFESASVALLRSFPPAQSDRGLYRPLTNFSHALEWPFFGDAARGYYAVNVALYAAVVLLLQALLRAYRFGALPAFAAALLFALHPVHSEVVDGIAGRSELLMLLFSFASLLCLLRGLPRPGAQAARRGVWPIAAVVFYAAAAGSKETGVVLPVLLAIPLVLARIADRRTSDSASSARRLALDLSPYFCVAVAYLILRVGALSRFGPTIDERSFEFADVGERLFTMGAVYLEYLRLLVWPDPLQIDFYYERAVGVQQTLGARVALGWAVLAATVALWAACARQLLVAARQPGFDPCAPRAALFLGISWFVVFLLPVSHAVDIGALMAERFLFAPSAGAILAVAAGALAWAGPGENAPGENAARIPPTRLALFALAFAGLCVAGAAQSRERAAQWRDPVALWSAYSAASPEDARGWATLGAVQLERGELEAARRALARAFELDPSDYGTLLNRAALLEAEGRPRDARRAYDAMLESGAVDFHVWLNRARIEARDGRFASARELIRTAIELAPNHAPSHATLASIETTLSRARAILEREELRARAGATPAAAWDEQVAQACRALGEEACEAEYRQRAARGAAPHLEPQL